MAGHSRVAALLQPLWLTAVYSVRRAEKQAVYFHLQNYLQARRLYLAALKQLSDFPTALHLLKLNQILFFYTLSSNGCSLIGTSLERRNRQVQKKIFLLRKIHFPLSTSNSLMVQILQETKRGAD